MQKTNKRPVAPPPTSQGCLEDTATSIYFDGSCPLCSVEVNHYASSIGRGKLHLVDVSVDGANLAPGLTAEDAIKRFHVRKPNGELVSGAKAFAEVWRMTPGWIWAARLAAFPGVLSLMEAFYRAFLLVRPAVSVQASALGLQAANPQPKKRPSARERRN